MKCIRCGEDSKKKDRTGRVCPKCARRFAFDPAEGDPFTDAAFQHALDVVGAEGTVRFHPLHVYYQLCRQLPAGGLGATLGNLADTVLGWFVKPAPKVSAVGLSPSAFDTLWRMWVAAHGKPKGLVEANERAPRKRSAELEAELEAYSFDRAVITDQPLLVDVLVANRFHFENNCALLSVGGHPPDAFDAVRRMLRNNPRLVVVAVHDASAAGCGLAHHLATDPAWFAGRARVVDVGLRPEHARLFPRQARPLGTPPKAPRPPGLADADWAWLQKASLSAFAIKPEQLVKRLYKAIVEAEAPGSAGGSGASDSGSGSAGGGDVFVYGGFGGDASSSDGGGDSFG